MWVLDKRWNIEECTPIFKDDFIHMVEYISSVYNKTFDRARIIMSVTDTEHMFKAVDNKDGTFSFEPTESTDLKVVSLLPAIPIHLFKENPFIEDVYNDVLYVNITWRKLPEVYVPDNHIIIPKENFEMTFTEPFLEIVKGVAKERGIETYDTIRLSTGRNAHMGGRCVLGLNECANGYEVDELFGHGEEILCPTFINIVNDNSIINTLEPSLYEIMVHCESKEHHAI